MHRIAAGTGWVQATFSGKPCVGETLRLNLACYPACTRPKLLSLPSPLSGGITSVLRGLDSNQRPPGYEPSELPSAPPHIAKNCRKYKHDPRPWRDLVGFSGRGSILRRMLAAHAAAIYGPGSHLRSLQRFVQDGMALLSLSECSWPMAEAAQALRSRRHLNRTMRAAARTPAPQRSSCGWLRRSASGLQRMAIRKGPRC